MRHKDVFGKLVVGAITALLAANGGIALASGTSNDDQGTCAASNSCSTRIFKGPDANQCSGKDCAGLSKDQCVATAGCAWTPAK